MRDSALEYELKLYNGASVRALIYLVYAEPLGKTGGRSTSAKSGTMGFNASNGKVVDREGYAWLPVTRGRCAKECTGPILSAIQRFGKQGRTQKGAAAADADKKRGAAPGAAAPGGEDKWKDARNLFVSIDEASNHVCAFGPNKCKVFRCARALDGAVFSRFARSRRVWDDARRGGARDRARTPSNGPLFFSSARARQGGRSDRLLSLLRFLTDRTPCRPFPPRSPQASVRHLRRGRRRVPRQRRLRPHPRPRQQ